MAAFAGPFFPLADTRSPVLICLALVVVMAFGHGAAFGPPAAFYAELFSARVRCSGVSIGDQAGSVVLGGFTPMPATSVILWSGGPSWSLMLLVAAGALVAAATRVAAPETFRRSSWTRSRAGPLRAARRVRRRSRRRTEIPGGQVGGFPAGQ
ncbi:hypothetical protein [Streptomyces sp. WAC05858]|uniref:hypothetical protein n=1 Tax=Streptomyces TaxID=1883 RepID=UPI000F768896|nr:hypothetical protein [Streptomyces sp. WAC05858]RSS48069.1 hypothetical protein EF902_06775 [Streptomyces sp. WAC05858]